MEKSEVSERCQGYIWDFIIIFVCVCNKVLLKYEGDRESFWHRHQKRAKEYPFASITNGVNILSNESKECLEAAKTSPDPLP